jgi:transposase
VRIFNLHRKTIYRWERIPRERRLAATENKIQKPEKLNPEELREYIKLHPDKTLKEIEIAFGINDTSALYRIRQFEITYKKSHYTRNERKTRGEHLRHFLAQSKYRVSHGVLASRPVTRMKQN